jgi:dolichol-phosphate mannosyltransferase
MSGHFMIRRDAFEALAPALSSQGFKILLDVLATARGRLRMIELPTVLRERQHGESKLDSRIALAFAALVTSKLTHDAISIRFVMFSLVGLTGVGIHMSILALGLLIAGIPFAVAQSAAAIGAMGWNFTLNNLFTYRDQRLAGWRFLTGLIRFQLICAIGAIANIGLAIFIYNGTRIWWLAGLAGVLIGAVWNYAVTSVFVWRPEQR